MQRSEASTSLNPQIHLWLNSNSGARNHSTARSESQSTELRRALAADYEGSGRVLSNTWQGSALIEKIF